MKRENTILKAEKAQTSTNSAGWAATEFDSLTRALNILMYMGCVSEVGFILNCFYFIKYCLTFVVFVKERLLDKLWKDFVNIKFNV